MVELTCCKCYQTFLAGHKGKLNLCSKCYKDHKAMMSKIKYEKQKQDKTLPWKNIKIECSICIKDFLGDKKNKLKRCDDCKKKSIECKICKNYYILGKNTLERCRKCNAKIINKGHDKESYKIYYEKNKEEIRARSADWYSKNRHRAQEVNIQWRQKNINKIQSDLSEWRKENPNYSQEYYQANRTKVLKQTATYSRKRRDRDPFFRVLHNLRTRIRQYIRSEKDSFVDCLGCTIVEFKLHLEQQFEVGMTWDNYGKKVGQWSVDHIIAVSKFDIADPESRKKINHYTNLQPLWHVDNMKKGCK